MTKREAILTALKAKLDGISPAPAGGVFRARVYALDRATSPAITIEPVSDSVEAGAPIPFLYWNLLVRIAVIVRGDIPDQLADPIIEQVHEAVMSDQGLGGLSMDIQPTNVTFEMIPGDQPIGVMSMGFTIKYATPQGSLSL